MTEHSFKVGKTEYVIWLPTTAEEAGKVLKDRLYDAIKRAVTIYIQDNIIRPELDTGKAPSLIATELSAKTFAVDCYRNRVSRKPKVTKVISADDLAKAQKAGPAAVVELLKSHGLTVE